MALSVQAAAPPDKQEGLPQPRARGTGCMIVVMVVVASVDDGYGGLNICVTLNSIC